MKGKANPFANLLSQLAPNATAPTGSPTEEDAAGCEEDAAAAAPEAGEDAPPQEDGEDKLLLSCDESGSDQAEDNPSSFKFGQTSKLRKVDITTHIMVYKNILLSA